MEWLVEWGYLGLFIGAIIGATIFPFSSEVVLVALLTHPSTNPYIAILCATLGNIIGGVISYYLGYLGKWEWIEKYLRIKRSRLESQKGLVERWGALLALFSWLPFVGDIFAVALGFYRVNFRRSVIFMFLGKGGRFVIWAILYYLAAPSFGWFSCFS